jgi:threonylcarbamoyladenosine tRNA methylthiotransferase MtaB
MKVYLSSLGCKLNESELEAWTRQFAAQGDEIVSDVREADLCVVNTCTVTQVAAHKSRGLVKKVAHANGNAKIVVTGCYATLSPDQALSLPNVALLVPNREKDQLVALAGEKLADLGYQMAESGCRLPEAASGELTSESYPRLSSVESGGNLSMSPIAKGGGRGVPHPRTRAFVKIEDGCNMSCTYCIIPFARGRARSQPQHEIVAQVARLVDNGYQEVILTGVQISDYHIEERAPGRGRLRGLCSLVREILDKTALPRLRLTSVAPWDLDEELLDLLSDERLCRHLHLSLQSGSTGVLRRMRRPYTAEQYAEAVARARAKVPDVGITTDVIVGFPGESEVEFEEALAFVERIKFARVHVFPYSARAGTVAAQFPLQVSEVVKDARAKAMQRVADVSAKNFASKFLGRTLRVLFETEALNRSSATPANMSSYHPLDRREHDDDGGKGQGSGLWSGYSDNYIRIQADSQQNLSNRIVLTRLEKITPDGAWGAVSS